MKKERQQKAKEKKIISKKSGRLIFAALIAIFILTGGVAAYNLITTEIQNNAAQNEYTELRELITRFAAPPGINESDQIPTDINPPSDTETQSPPPVNVPDLTMFNPDYIGWIRINGTEIDYPVVQGANNTKYLNTTFMGERNPSGTIFMDYENIDGFMGFAILHGHNMRNGTMFAGLHRFREDDFRAEFDEITIFTPDGETLTYRIFDIILTNNRDPVFQLPIEGQQAFSEYFEKYDLTGSYIKGRSGVLILSTCTDGNRNERLLVLAERV
jgi:sortase B